jgi:hypothetical protein
LSHTGQFGIAVATGETAFVQNNTYNVSYERSHAAANHHRIFFFIFHFFLLCFNFSGVQFIPESRFFFPGPVKGRVRISVPLTLQFLDFRWPVAIVDVVRHPNKS